MKEKRKIKSYLTPNEVAELLMVSPVTIRQWAQKGEIKALSTPGGHRRFMVREVERFAREHGLTLQPVDDDALRILIVDDDRQFAGFLVEFLGGLKDKIVTDVANDGFDAGSKMHTFQPHVVLLDLMMPGVDGFEVCRLLKENPATKAIRVIAMTGFFSPENTRRIINAGAETCLAKPIDTGVLLDKIGIRRKTAIADRPRPD